MRTRTRENSMVTAAQQITQLISLLEDTLCLKGWPNSRREDLRAITQVLAEKWSKYQAGMLPAFDETVEV